MTTDELQLPDQELVLLRMHEDSPRIRHRDRHLSVGRGGTAEVPKHTAERLLEEREYFEVLCGVRKDSGARCERLYNSCQYHRAASEDSDISADDTGDSGEDAGSTDGHDTADNE